jgi:ABC-type uncharacterized transport system permease subunit
VALFVAAVFLARLLLAGGAAWVAFALCLPVVLFVLTARAGFRAALAVTAGFTLLVLGLKWVLRRSPTGWVVLLLLPVLLLTAVLAGRVLAQLRRDRRDRDRHDGAAPREDDAGS